MSQYIAFQEGVGTTLTAAPAARTEIPTAANLRWRTPADLTNCLWAVLNVGGGVSGIAGCYVSVDYTLDLTGATGWAPLCGTTLPMCPISNLGGGVAGQYGPASEIVEAARTLVLLRPVVAGGNGSTAPTISAMGMWALGPMLFDGNSLDGVADGPNDFLFFGGSLMGGGGTVGTDAGEFGELPAPLRPIPDGMTVIRDGSPLAVFSTGAHGVEAGFAAELADEGLASGVRLICRYVDATGAADWTNTHLATLAADVAAASATPKLAFYAGSVTDAASAAAVASYDEQLRRLRGKVRQLFGCGLVVIDHVSTDATAAPQAVEARAVIQRRLGEPHWGTTAAIAGSGVALQADNIHPDSDGTVDMGRRFGALAVAEGLL